MWQSGVVSRHGFQPCRNWRQINTALAAEDLLLSYRTDSERQLCSIPPFRRDESSDWRSSLGKIIPVRRPPLSLPGTLYGQSQGA
jgi:hypothetical protein